MHVVPFSVNHYRRYISFNWKRKFLADRTETKTWKSFEYVQILTEFRANKIKFVWKQKKRANGNRLFRPITGEFLSWKSSIEHLIIETELCKSCLLALRIDFHPRKTSVDQIRKKNRKRRRNFRISTTNFAFIRFKQITTKTKQNSIKQFRFPKERKKNWRIKFLSFRNFVYHFLIFQQLMSYCWVVRPWNEVFRVSKWTRFWWEINNWKVKF